MLRPLLCIVVLKYFSSDLYIFFYIEKFQSGFREFQLATVQHWMDLFKGNCGAEQASQGSESDASLDRGPYVKRTKLIAQ